MFKGDREGGHVGSVGELELTATVLVVDPMVGIGDVVFVVVVVVVVVVVGFVVVVDVACWTITLELEFTAGGIVVLIAVELERLTCPE
mmetsp:Transcript_31432/g.55552  ORF Transcript_31432/g.55552 Transcript_31432/m.55552 type:complete len:88 (-) Transcript_31432:196-459(-)